MSNLQYRGSNLCGGDTAYTDWQGSSPVSGTHYLFISNAEVDYLLAKGCNCFRLLFTWEAMQPVPLAAIPGTGNFGTYYSKFKALVDYITSKGASVIIDIHGGLDAGFAAYFGVKIGSTYQGYPVADLFVDLWSKLATIFKSNVLVMFGITNEPSNMPTATWFTAAQRVINAIRLTGSKNKILMPGVDYTGAGTWTADSGPGWDNANGTGKPLTDPASNLAVQVHMYFDADGGGGDTTIASADIGVTRMKNVVTWARARGLTVFLAEVGLAASNSLAASAWQQLQAYLTANQDVVIGFTFWACGPASWWGGYQFTLCPKGSVDSAQMKLIAPALVASVITPPVVTPPVVTPPATDPQVAVLQAQVATLTSQVATLTTAANAALAKIVAAKAALA